MTEVCECTWQHLRCPTNLGRRRAMVAEFLPRSRLCQLTGRWPADSKPWISNSPGVFASCAQPGARTNTSAELFPQPSHANRLLGICAGTAGALEGPLCSSILGDGRCGSVDQDMFIKEEGKKVLTASYSSGYFCASLKMVDTQLSL